MVAGTWLAAFGTLIPTWRGKWGRFGLDASIGSCTIIPENGGFLVLSCKSNCKQNKLLFTSMSKYSLTCTLFP